jgi:hypothetical protein
MYKIIVFQPAYIRQQYRVATNIFRLELQCKEETFIISKSIY